jgi:hypothetical protein
MDDIVKKEKKDMGLTSPVGNKYLRASPKSMINTVFFFDEDNPIAKFDYEN